MQVIDLSQELTTGMQVHPLHSPTHLLPWARHAVSGFQSEVLFCNSHAGTHVDAPRHFLEAGEPVDAIPLERFFGPAVVFDLSHLAPRTHIAAAELQRCAEAIPLRSGDMLLLHTGISRGLGEPAYLTDAPGLSGEAAVFLAEKGVKAVGIDAPGIDPPDAPSCPAHHVLLPRGILVYENLTNTDRLVAVASGRRFVFHGLPLRIGQAGGSPVRAMAIVE